LTGTTVLTRGAGLQWRCLPFNALSAEALYRLLRLRSEVFVVEQNCVFVDPDGTVHLHASTRLVPPGVAFAEASIGRVVTAPAARGGGIGHALMAESLRLLEQLWGSQPVRIGAQAHLESFYQRHGFVSDNKPYIEDGIPHLEMLRR
jgi:ElaA protein